MIAVLGFVSALLYGGSDFLGGLAARRMTSLVVSFVAVVVAIVVCAVTMLFVPGAWSTEAVVLGALAGIFGSIGTWAFYACLALGPMSVLSPGVAVIYAVLPAIAGILLGERFPPIGYVALVAVVIAAVMLSVTREGVPSKVSGRAIVLGVIAGVGFAGYIILIDRSPEESGLVPLLADLVVGAVLYGAVLLIGRLRSGPAELAAVRPSTGLWQAMGAGALLVSGNILLVIGLHLGDLAVMGVLNSLYPLGTVLLALIILRERLTVLQGIGVGLALAASVALALV
ncbi:DMT family transporter [soil metagenome]